MVEPMKCTLGLAPGVENYSRMTIVTRAGGPETELLFDALHERGRYLLHNETIWWVETFRRRASCDGVVFEWDMRGASPIGDA